MGRFAEPEEIAAAACFLALRRVVHHGEHVPRRWRHPRRLRDAAVIPAESRLVCPVVGVTAYDEEAAWGVWHKQASLVHSRVREIATHGPPTPSSSRSKKSTISCSTPYRASGRPAVHGGTGHRPGPLRRKTPSSIPTAPTRPRRTRAGAAVRGRARGPAGARHLQGHAGSQRGSRRHARPAPARRRRSPGSQSDARHLLPPPGPRAKRQASSTNSSPGTRGPYRPTITRGSTAWARASRPWPGPTTARSKRSRTRPGRFSSACSGTPKPTTIRRCSRLSSRPQPALPRRGERTGACGRPEAWHRRRPGPTDRGLRAGSAPRPYTCHVEAKPTGAASSEGGEEDRVLTVPNLISVSRIILLGVFC